MLNIFKKKKEYYVDLESDGGEASPPSAPVAPKIEAAPETPAPQAETATPETQPEKKKKAKTSAKKQKKSEKTKQAEPAQTPTNTVAAAPAPAPAPLPAANFAPTFLNPARQFTPRRRPGANMSSFLDMARGMQR